MCKKVYILFLFATSLAFSASAQNVSINADGAAPDSSAMLDVSDTTRGFLPPRMTTNQMNNISGPASGLFIYNTDSLGYMYYNGSSWEAIGTASASANSSIDSAAESGVLILSDVKTSGTDGGAFSSGSWQTRDMNTKSGDTSFVSLSSNEFTLQEGVYLIEASAPAFRVGHHRARIYNVTDGAEELRGQNQFSINSASADQTSATVRGVIQSSGGKTYRLEHRAQADNLTNGYGPTHAIAGETEIYSTIKIIKLDKVFGSGTTNSSTSTTVDSIGESGIVLIKDIKPNGTNGGSFTTGSWRIRDLDTLMGDQSFVSLTANEFNLSSGTYLIEWAAPAFAVNTHKSRLYNVTDATTVALGSSEGYNVNVSTISKGSHLIDVSSTKTFRIEHRAFSTNNGNGFGIASSFGTEDEVYTQVKIIKLDKVFGSGTASSGSSVVDTLDENVFSARITNNGTAAIASQNIDFIASVNRTGLGVIDVVFNSGFFTVTPSVVATVTNDVTVRPAIVSLTTTGFTIDTREVTATSTPFDRDVSIVVVNQGADYKYNTAGGSSSNSSNDTLPLIKDADGNTMITTEQSANEDTIRFFARGTEVMTIDSAHVTFNNKIVLPETLADSSGVIMKNGVPFLHTYNDPSAAFSGRNLYIGENAGNFTQDLNAELNTGVGWQSLTNLTSGGANAGFGYRSLDAVTSGRQNVAIGYNAMRNDTVGSFNAALGSAALRFSDGDLNTALGHNAMRLAFGTPTGNTAVGAQTLYQVQGSYNVALGDSAGYNNISGFRNVFIGSKAGLNELGDNKLYIANDSTNTPLIWGDFANDSVKIYGTLSIGDSISFPTNRGTNGQVLTSNGLGKAAWQSPSSGKTLIDGDGNTQIQVEETSNDDIIRFDMNGTEFFRMDSGRIEVLNTGRSIFIGEDAGINDDYSSNQNIGIGWSSLDANTTGTQNIGLGNNTLGSNTTGNLNLAIGNSALAAVSTGSNNVAVGAVSLFFINSGSENTAVGKNAGLNVTGSNNIFLGFNAGSSAGNTSNKLYIEPTSSSTPLIYGDFALDSLAVNGILTANNGLSVISGNVGIGVSSPAVQLTIGPADDDTGLETNSDGNLGILTNGTERVRINENGFVGIGTTNPLGNLMVQSPTDSAEIYLIGNTNADEEHIYFGYNNGVNLTGQIGMSSDLDLRAANGRDISFYTQGSKGGSGLDTASSVELAMTVAGDGNIGIGTFSPQSELHINDDDDNTVTLRMTNSATASLGFWLQSNSAQAGIINYENTPLNLGTNGANRLTIDASGNVGIGNTSPNAPLQFANSTANRKLVLFESTNNDHQFYGLGVNSNVLRYQTSSSAADHVFYSAFNSGLSTELMRIEGDGNVGIGITDPDQRLDVGGNIELTGEIHTTSTGNVNMIPIAMATIDGSSGSINTSTGNVTSLRASSGEYRITISGHTASVTSNIIMATIVGDNGGQVTVEDGGTFYLVNTRNSAGSRTDKDFCIIIYDP